MMRKQTGLTMIELMLVLGLLGVIFALAIPAYGTYRDKLDAALVEAYFVEVDAAIQRYLMENGGYPPDLATIDMLEDDPWGNPYQYLDITTAKGNGKKRKDRNLVPINTDYDLYSMGPDGKSVSPLTAQASRDDIIRANNGAYIGPAAEF